MVSALSFTTPLPLGSRDSNMHSTLVICLEKPASHVVGVSPAVSWSLPHSCTIFLTSSSCSAPSPLSSNALRIARHAPGESALLPKSPVPSIAACCPCVISSIVSELLLSMSRRRKRSYTDWR